MNALHPQPKKRRPISPLAWAGGGTLLLHGVFLLTLWLWPKTPEKPRETLLEVDLRQDKKPQVATSPKPKPQPTPKQKLEVKPRVARVETPKPLPKPVPVSKPRLAKVPVATPEPIPTVVKKVETVPTPPPPPPEPQKPEPKPKVVIKPKNVEPKVNRRRLLARSNDSETPRPTRQPDITNPKSASKTRDNETAVAPTNSKPKDSPRRTRRARSTGSSGGSPASPKSNTSGDETPAPSGGKSGRRMARNDEPESSSGRTNTPENSSGGSSAAGFNPRRQSDDAAGGEPDVNLPRTRARRGRSGSLDAPLSSAPTSSADGTEVNLGPSRPTSSGGGSRRASFDTGEGEDTTGSPIRRGLKNAGGAGNNGNAKAGRGTDIAGDGAGNGTAGNGIGSGTGRGRGRSRLAGDPFSNGGDGNGRGNNGNGPGAGDSGNGNGTGPKGGTRLAKRNLGDGDSDGKGEGVGRGIGLGTGDGNGSRGTAGNSAGNGRGGENADGDGGGRSRVGRGRGGHRETEAEDQIGRGIWGGFKIRYYQDKADHPDLPDGTFYPGNPIDWPVFTQLMAQKTSPNLDFDWGTTPPAAGMKYTFWSMKAAGRIFVPKDDTYEFFFDELDDAGSLVLDGKTIIKVWQVQKSSPSSGKMFLKRGPHDIQIEYVQGPATAASIKLSWKSTSFPREIVGVYQAPKAE